jgi:alcohol dehydrogenase YqhD (iron-dependent ADH family)
MNNFNFYSPTFFAFGKDRERDTGALVKRFGGGSAPDRVKVLIHYGGGSVVRSGLLDRVKASLEAEAIPFVELGAKEEDIPKLVNSLCHGNGRQGRLTGFTTLNEEDCANIYRLML